MKKIVLSAIAIAFTLCSCTSHDEGNVNEYNNALIKENAQKVFGNIDAAQDWNSIKQGSVTITADANLDNIEKVQILTESPFGNKDAAILNEAKVEKGQKVTLVYDAPNVYDKLFAACVSSEGKYFVKVFNIGESSVSFKSTAAARMTRSGEGYPSLTSIVLGTPTPSFNAQRAIQSLASEDHTVLINDNVGGGNYRAYDLWADGTWANEKMFAVTSTPDNGWTFENGTIWKTVDDDVDITTVKEIVNEFLSKTGAIHTTNNKSNNWETIVESTPYFVLNKNYLIATGEPVTITPIQMNTTEGKFNTVYYYFTISGSGPDGLGAISNKKTVSNVYGTAYLMRDIELADDAAIGGTSYVSLKFGDWVAGTVVMDGHALTLTNATVYAGNRTYVGEGRIEIGGGAALSFYQHNSSASNCVVTVYGNLNQNAGGFTAVKSLVFENGASFWSRAATGHPTTIVFDTYAPNMIHTGSELTGPAEKTTFQPGATVSVKLGDRTIGDQDGKKVASWSVRPQGVKFVCGDEGKSYMFAAESDGLYIYRGFSILLY